VFRIKCTGRNNFRTNHFRSSAISGLFKACFKADLDISFAAIYIPLKGGGGLVFTADLATPSKFFMRPPWDSKRTVGLNFASLKQKKIGRSRIRQIGRLVECLGPFATIKSLAMRCRQRLVLRPSTNTGPGMTI
jgi:hypothetical protein